MYQFNKDARENHSLIPPLSYEKFKLKKKAVTENRDGFLAFYAVISHEVPRMVLAMLSNKLSSRVNSNALIIRDIYFIITFKVQYNLF
jgi:hypothetical protein